MRNFPRICRRLGAALAMALLLLGAGCLSPKPFDEAAWQKTVAATDPAKLHAPHQDAEGRYFNPWLPQDKSSWDLFRWWLSRSSLGDWDDADYPTPTVANDGAYLRDPAAPAVNLHVEIHGNLLGGRDNLEDLARLLEGKLRELDRGRWKA